MPFVPSADAKLFYEENGAGYPVIFVHEYANDYRGWDDQVRYFSRYYRCISFNARGYPPSEVPSLDSSYGYEHAVDDIATILKTLKIERADIVGLSMGGFATLLFGLYPEMASALIVAGCGSGSDPSYRPTYLREIAIRADRLKNEGIDAKVNEAINDPSRVQLRDKDPKGWAEYLKGLRQHSGGAARAPERLETCADFRSTSVSTVEVAP